MSEGVDLADFRDAFVEETAELLEAASAQALTLEAALRDGADQARPVRELFRAVHTIKGLASMVNVEPIVAIAHAMEEMLRVADRHATLLSSSAIDGILSGLAAIDQRVKSVGSAQPVAEPPADVLAALTEKPAQTAIRSEPSAEAVFTLDSAVASRLSQAERQQLVRGVSEGKRALRMDFAPSPERAAQGHTVTSMRERLGKIADIVKVVPMNDPSAPSGISFVLLLLSEKADEELLSAVVVPLAPPQQIVAMRQGAAPMREDVLESDAVRVDVSRLDIALDKLSDLVITRYRLSNAVLALRERGVDVREISEVVNENARQLRELRSAVLHVRMVSLDNLFSRMRLVVRGLTRGTQKRVQLELDAAGAEVDKTVAELVFPAIMHLVRNAIDHGLEPVLERERAAKPAEGRLRIHCKRASSTQLEIVIEDDGRGVDAKAVCARASVPLTTSPAILLDLLCAPGFSTRDEASTTSGRGMGMDIVKRAIVDRLGGELSLETELGRGTRFVLRVPLSISILDAFVFCCGAQRFVVPNASIEEAIEVPQVAHPQGDAVGMIVHRGEAMPFVELARILRLPSASSPQAFVIRKNGELLALGVDKILTQQEIVVRPLEDKLVKVAGISGAADLGDGKPTLVLDLARLEAQ